MPVSKSNIIKHRLIKGKNGTHDTILVDQKPRFVGTAKCKKYKRVKIERGRKEIKIKISKNSDAKKVGSGQRGIRFWIKKTKKMRYFVNFKNLLLFKYYGRKNLVQMFHSGIRDFWEGDILEGLTHERNVVIFKNGSFYWHGHLLSNVAYNVRKIGNIYENPDIETLTYGEAGIKAGVI